MTDAEITYHSYLNVDTILGAQNFLTNSDNRDELLFIIVHQTTELWYKVILREVNSLRELLRTDMVQDAIDSARRIVRIQDTLIQHWAILATLQPSDYDGFRHLLGSASGFQSFQFRLVEFTLGSRDHRQISVFRKDLGAYEKLTRELTLPSVYDELLALVQRSAASALAGPDYPDHHNADDHARLFSWIYQKPHPSWILRALCDELLDVDERFRTWRFHHLETVTRIIGSKPGTGGTTGIRYLRERVDKSYFPGLRALNY